MLPLAAQTVVTFQYLVIDHLLFAELELGVEALNTCDSLIHLALLRLSLDMNRDVRAVPIKMPLA